MRFECAGIFIMLNMQSLAWHFIFELNLALFTLRPAERDDFRSQDLVVHNSLKVSIYVAIIGSVKQSLLCLTWSLLGVLNCNWQL